VNISQSDSKFILCSPIIEVVPILFFFKAYGPKFYKNVLVPQLEAIWSNILSSNILSSYVLSLYSLCPLFLTVMLTTTTRMSSSHSPPEIPISLQAESGIISSSPLYDDIWFIYPFYVILKMVYRWSHHLRCFVPVTFTETMIDHLEIGENMQTMNLNSVD
jgi:hypothetical protein